MNDTQPTAPHPDSDSELAPAMANTPHLETHILPKSSKEIEYFDFKKKSQIAIWCSLIVLACYFYSEAHERGKSMSQVDQLAKEMIRSTLETTFPDTAKTDALQEALERKNVLSDLNADANRNQLLCLIFGILVCLASYVPLYQYSLFANMSIFMILASFITGFFILSLAASNEYHLVLEKDFLREAIEKSNSLKIKSFSLYTTLLSTAIGMLTGMLLHIRKLKAASSTISSIAPSESTMTVSYLDNLGTAHEAQLFKPAAFELKVGDTIHILYRPGKPKIVFLYDLLPNPRYLLFIIIVMTLLLARLLTL